MSVYYNENDPKVAAWLRELIATGLIASGDVDDRSVVDVQPGDLDGYTQCHFFAGIGGWAYALELAGWSGRPIWTGSCPCQPFSTAGRGKGEQDERHLWPEFYRLIAQCKPATVFGEQVASKLGRAWLARVQTDLETLGYATAGADLCAAGVGAPHPRQRLYWVADSDVLERGVSIRPRLQNERFPETGRRSTASGLGHTNGESGVPPAAASEGQWDGGYIPCADGKHRRIKPGISPMVDGFPGRMDLVRGYGNAIVPQVAATFVSSYLEVAA